ncbi:MAG: hypothetical protein L0G39_01350 [Chryseobacterium sp.]|nr:hypothetical protein [Chryseobacterium sp.]MDN5475551.1 hypothetical protein [Chryseobacterium sp.]
MKKIILLTLASFSQFYFSQSWNTMGNSGTNPATDFVGTRDNQPLVFKINGSEKMRLSPNGRLVFYDIHSQTWAYNLYIGGGNEVPSNNPGGINYANVAVGLGSMSSNTTGSSNTALGYNTMTNSTTGTGNLALGINAMQLSVNASNNVAVGLNNLSGMVNGEFNTAVGFMALRAWGSTASVPLIGNTAVGKTALLRLLDGNYNTVMGQNSFMNTKKGNYNIAIGSNNAPDAENAAGNIFIGNNLVPVNPQPSNELNIGNWIVGNNGTIGIGQFTNPLPANGSTSDGTKYKLFVKEGIRTEKVKVDIASANGWADYVFKKDYKLSTLDAVEKHIEEKGHLPNIPSAQEVVKNGINLGEMDAKLLEKIEELTLYVIQLNKGFKQLREENKELKKTIELLKK